MINHKVRDKFLRSERRRRDSRVNSILSRNNRHLRSILLRHPNLVRPKRKCRRATPLSSFLSGDVRRDNVCFALFGSNITYKGTDLSDAIEEIQIRACFSSYSWKMNLIFQSSFFLFLFWENTNLNISKDISKRSFRMEIHFKIINHFNFQHEIRYPFPYFPLYILIFQIWNFIIRKLLNSELNEYKSKCFRFLLW